MSATDRDVTRVVRSWLREDEHENADRVLDLVLDQLDTTPQRRATWWPVRRPTTMNTPFRYGIAAVALAVAALLGFTYLNNQVGDPDPTPIPSDLSVVPLPAGQPFTSRCSSSSSIRSAASACSFTASLSRVAAPPARARWRRTWRSGCTTPACQPDE